MAAVKDFDKPLISKWNERLDWYVQHHKYDPVAYGICISLISQFIEDLNKIVELMDDLKLSVYEVEDDG